MNTRPLRVLVTDGDYKHTLGAVRSLARDGFEVDVMGRQRSLTAWSRYLSKIAYPQERFCDDLIDEFISLLADSHYEVLLPIGARSVQLVSQHRKAIQEHCAIPIASPEAIELCLDKEATGRFAVDTHVKVPQTWAFKCLNELKAHISEIVFPAVIKGKSEVLKDRPFCVHNADQLLKKVTTWGKGLSSEELPFPIIQQYIHGVGLGFFSLYQHGQCKRVFMHRRIRETPPTGGVSCCAVSIYESDLLATGKKLLDALAWHGVAMVEFKRERSTGDLYLLEINPKFWGSLDLAIASGVDFPVLDVRMAIGKEISYSDIYKVGLKFHWPLDGEISHIKKNPKAIFSVLVDSIDPHVKSNLSLVDPLPAVHSLYMEALLLARWILNKYGLNRLVHRIRKQGLKVAIMRTYSEFTGIPLFKYSQITPQIYIGSQHGLAGKRKLKRLGISGVVNMRSEFDDNSNDLVLGKYCHLPTAEFTSPTIEQLHEGVDFIRRMIEEGGNVYIHCTEGVSRAATLAVAYFISQGMALSDAVALIKKSRPFINILPVQMDRLKEFVNIYSNGKA